MGEQNPLATMGTPSAAPPSGGHGFAMQPTSQTPLVGGSSGDNSMLTLLNSLMGGGGGQQSPVLQNLPGFQLAGGHRGEEPGLPKTGKPPGSDFQDPGVRNTMTAIGSLVGIAAAIASMASSEKLKTDIGALPGSRRRLAEDVYRMPVKTWRYLWDDPARRRVGPMLETMPPFMRNDEHHFDPVSMFGAIIATVQSQNDRLRRLEGRR